MGGGAIKKGDKRGKERVLQGTETESIVFGNKALKGDNVDVGEIKKHFFFFFVI